jgi:hypothetical protein
MRVGINDGCLAGYCSFERGRHCTTGHPTQYMLRQRRYYAARLCTQGGFPNPREIRVVRQSLGKWPMILLRLSQREDNQELPATGTRELGRPREDSPWSEARGGPRFTDWRSPLQPESSKQSPDQLEQWLRR